MSDARKRFAGAPMPVTVEFRASVKAWVRGALGRQAQLARTLGVDHANLTALIAGRTKTSALVGPISALLNIPLPLSSLLDADFELAITTLKAANPAKWRELRELCIAMAHEVTHPDDD